MKLKLKHCCIIQPSFKKYLEKEMQNDTRPNVTRIKLRDVRKFVRIAKIKP